jgi:hypothetical protein
VYSTNTECCSSCRTQRLCRWVDRTFSKTLEGPLRLTSCTGTHQCRVPEHTNVVCRNTRMSCAGTHECREPEHTNVVYRNTVSATLNKRLMFLLKSRIKVTNSTIWKHLSVKQNVKLCLCTPWRHMGRHGGAVELQLHSLLNWTVGEQLHVRSLCLPERAQRSLPPIE